MTRPADIPQWADSHPLTPEIMQDPIAHKIWEIRQQVSINSQIIAREYPDNPPSVMPHTVEILNGHINDRVAELETAIERALLAAYERGRGEQSWQDMDTAPKDGSWFIARWDGRATPAKWLSSEENEYNDVSEFVGARGFPRPYAEEPDAWQPFPEAT